MRGAARAAKAARAAEAAARAAANALARLLREHRPDMTPTRRLIMGSAAAGLALAALTVALSGPWDGGQRTAEREAAAQGDQPGHDPGTGDGSSENGEAGELGEIAGGIPVADEVLSPLSHQESAQHPLPAAAALERALAPALDDPALGPGATGSVVDVATGTTLYADGASTPMTPASTAKVVTAVAALATLGPDHRLATTAVWDAGHRRLVLVGGGDTTLRSADLKALAERSAAALAEQGVTRAEVAYDVSLYPGEQHPIGVNDNIAPITPLQVNTGRLDDSRQGPAPRSTDPAGDAAAAFAGYLRDAGLQVPDDPPGRHTAPAGAEQAERLAVHRSAPLATLVEEMLTHSDNDLAEALGRHTALAVGEDGDFEGLGRAVTGLLDQLGLPGEGVRMTDGSGLDREARLPARLLTEALALAGDPGRPELRPALTGLPVAGFTGTLADRYDPGSGSPTAAGAGLVRAKTGTLTGVTTLAGTAITPEGRVLVFAFLAGGTTDPVAAQAALDTAASALASCACR